MKFAEGYGRRVVVKIDDMDLPFISFTDLIKNKNATGHGKDRVDVEELQKRSQR